MCQKGGDCISTTTIERLQVELAADVADLKKGLESAKKQLASIEKQTDNTGMSLKSMGTMAKTILGSYIVKGFLSAGKSSTDMAMDVVESESLFETSLGNMANTAREWSEEISTALGLNAYTLRNQLGTLYNMTTSMEIADKTAYTLSTTITQLAQDMASFYNMSTDEAFYKLRSGLTGETEPLKALGILVDEATAKQAAYKHGIAQTGEELTQQQKVLGRYYAILDQTKNAQGDLARTIDSPANQMRILKEQVNQLSITFGQALIPVMQEILPYFVVLANKTAELIANLFGVERAATSIADNLTNQKNSADTAIESEKELADAIDETTQKKKKAMLGFDELNVLSDSNESAADSLDIGDFAYDLSSYDATSGLTSVLDNKALKNASKNLDAIFGLLEDISPLLLLIGGTKVLKGVNSLAKAFSTMSSPLKNVNKWVAGVSGGLLAWNFGGSFVDDLRTLSEEGEGLENVLIDIGGIVGGIVMAGASLGPLGAVGATLATVASGIWKNYEVVKETAIAELYDEIGLSASQMSTLLDGLGDEIFEQAELTRKYESDCESLQKQYEDLADTFLVGASTINTAAGDTDEDIENVMKSLTEMVETCDEKLRTTTDAALDAYTKMFLENDGMISEEERNILNSMEANYANQKSRLDGIQKEITNIFSNAMKERGYLLDSEIAEIKELMDMQAQLANFDSLVRQYETESLVRDIRAGRVKVSKENLENILSDVQETLTSAQEEARNTYAVNRALAESTLSGKELNTALDEAKKNYEKAMQQLSRNAENVLNAVYYQLKDQMPTGNYEKDHGNAFLNGLADVGLSIMAFFGEEEYTGNTAQAREIEAMLERINSIKAISQYASGGYVPTGDLFIANENGPEMIGRIGGRTAVANTAQIENSIADAVYRAISAAGQSGNIIINAQGEAGLIRYLKLELDKESKRKGVSIVT